MWLLLSAYDVAILNSFSFRFLFLFCTHTASLPYITSFRIVVSTFERHPPPPLWINRVCVKSLPVIWGCNSDCPILYNSNIRLLRLYYSRLLAFTLTAPIVTSHIKLRLASAKIILSLLNTYYFTLATDPVGEMSTMSFNYLCERPLFCVRWGKRQHFLNFLRESMSLSLSPSLFPSLLQLCPSCSHRQTAKLSDRYCDSERETESDIMPISLVRVSLPADFK